MTDTVMTRDGLAKLTAELDELRSAGRARIAARLLAAAAAESNAGESTEFQDALEDRALLERRIALLELAVAGATVIDPDPANGRVDVGESVTVRDVASGELFEYQIVGTHETAPAEGRISVASPLGAALLGRAVGDGAVVDAPRGRLQFEVVAIRGDRPRSRATFEAPPAA